MRNKILATALLLALPFFITACTLQDLPLIGKYLPNTTPAAKPVTLNVWGLWESPDVMKTLIAKYRVLHPNVTINYDDRSVLKLEDYKDTVYTRANQGDTPDIVFVHNSWVKGLKDSLAPAPAKLITPQTYTTRFYDVAKQSAVIENNVYALPLYYDGLVLVYNKKHFEEIDQKEAPTAWEEFRRLAMALTIRGAGQTLVRAGAAIGAADNIDFAPDILGLMLAQAKVNVPDDLDTKPAQDALSFYTNFVKKDKVWDTTFPEATVAFSREKVSMIFIPTWNLLDIVTARPDLSIGVAPVPQALPNEPVSWSSFWMTAVTSGSKNKDVAWDFINFLSQNDQQLALFSENSKFRKFGSAYSAVDLKAQLDGNVYLKPLLDTAPFSASSRLASRSGNKASIDAIREAIDTVLKDETGQNKVIVDALTTAKPKVTNTR